MKSLNSEEIRVAWLNNVGKEGMLWLSHIDKKSAEIKNLQAKSHFVPMFELAELQFHIFSFCNWLAHVDLRNSKYIKEPEIIGWLQEVTSWPLEIIEAFWFCLRNPLMHTGRTFIFSDYDRESSSKLKLFADFHPDLDFDPKRFQPNEFKPSSNEDGWLAVQGPEDPNELIVTFYFPGVRRKLEIMKSQVMENIRTADHDTLIALRKVNEKILTFRVY